MILPWRRKRRNSAAVAAATELKIPTDFRCPISLDLMKDPVTLSTGITYDRNSIETWIIDQGHDTCPVTKRVLPVLDPVPNHAIRRMIQDWCVEKKSYGVERIPTPRIPLSSIEASDLLARLESSTAEVANTLVARILSKARESERNRRVILAQGGARVISSKFEEFSENDQNGVVLDELLACLALFSPALDHVVGSSKSLKRIVSILRNGDLASRRNAVTVLKEAVASRAGELAATEGALEGLVNAVKDPVSPSTLKDSLYVIYHILKSRPEPEPVSELINLGIVSEVVEIAISSERSVCEMALGVFDEVCRDESGRVRARGHAMAVPVVVKKMLRVSDLATEFSVSALWKMSREDESVLNEALEVGAFQKLLLVLQVGCGNNDEAGRTKEKATELLKRLNVFQRETGRLECVESMDFKELKRSF
ncbi:hypothetical protein V2J09_012691 [Rumex salicifolius]